LIAIFKLPVKQAIWSEVSPLRFLLFNGGRLAVSKRLFEKTKWSRVHLFILLLFKSKPFISSSQSTSYEWACSRAKWIRIHLLLCLTFLSTVSIATSRLTTFQRPLFHSQWSEIHIYVSQTFKYTHSVATSRFITSKWPPRMPN
jgi:hypothetical protein